MKTSSFLLFKETYSALTTKGLGEKAININHIVHITNKPYPLNVRLKSIKSRITHINGEILDVKLSCKEILEAIKTES